MDFDSMHFITSMLKISFNSANNLVVCEDKTRKNGTEFFLTTKTKSENKNHCHIATNACCLNLIRDSAADIKRNLFHEMRFMKIACLYNPPADFCRSWDRFKCLGLFMNNNNNNKNSILNGFCYTAIWTMVLDSFSEKLFLKQVLRTHLYKLLWSWSAKNVS